MNNAISNNLNYDMPDDSFFNFYFLIHKNRIFTTKNSFEGWRNHNGSAEYES